MRGIIIFFIFMAIISEGFCLEIKSSAFENGGYIPEKYTCDSVDISPPLSWSDVPPNTKSFVLICDDPDAPYGVWVHWVIFNIPADQSELKEGISKKGVLEKGIIQGINDFGNIGYGGPCPPPGKSHRYFFKLYALDTTLDLEEGATKKSVVEQMKGHIIAETKIVGLYQRK
jgi:hypothetical protein